MKKLLFALVCILILVFALTSTALAASRSEVAGEWTWVNTGGSEKPVPVDHGNLPPVGFVGTGTEVGTWTGSFNGTSDDVFHYVVTPSIAFMGTLIAYFDGEVNGVDGTMTMRITFRAAPGADTMSGHWSICDAGGGLWGLRGTGTWWTEPDHATYTGTIVMR